MKTHDIVCIGDTTIDAFIRLHEASVHCDLNQQNCQLCISYADKVPYDSLQIVPAVGNAANVAVGTARLGLRSAMFSAVGSDDYGRQILGVYRQEKVNSDLVRVNRGRATNYHFVLNFRAERTILIKHNLYQYYDPRKIGSMTKWIFFSALGENSLPFHRRLASYLMKNPTIRMGFTPNTFQLKLGAKKLAGIYRNTYALLVNREEAQRILGGKTSEVKTLLRGLHALGPRTVVITDGPAGAYASDLKTQYFMPIYPDPKPPFERTGCGDAFASGFMAGLIKGLPFTEVLRWAPINSMSVVQYTGAQRGLLRQSQLMNYLKKAPTGYKPKKI